MTEREELRRIRGLHRELGRAIAEAIPSFAALRSFRTRTPERPDMVLVLGGTASIATALAGFLETLDALLPADGAVDEASLDEASALLDELEPITTPGEPSRPSRGPRDTPLRELARHFYGEINAVDNALVGAGVPKSFAFEQTKELWIKLVYLGGTHMAGGLLARLRDRRWLHPRGSSGGRTRSHDVGELRAIAARAKLLRDASNDEFDAEHRRVWCGVVDAFIEQIDRRPEQRPFIGKCLGFWLSNAPAPQPVTLERYRAIAENVHLTDAVRAIARAGLP